MAVHASSIHTHTHTHTCCAHQISTLGLVVVSSVIRSQAAFSQMTEYGLTLVMVAIAIVLAGASGPFRWQLAAGEADVCSAAANSHSYAVYQLADWIGTG